jgi:restriction system protein
MGGLWFQRIELASTLSEIVGYKAGLALSSSDIASHLGDYGAEYMEGEPDDVLRVRSDEFEDMIARLLYAVGNTEVPHRVFPAVDLYHRFKTAPQGVEKVTQFLEIATELLNAQSGATGQVDLTPVLERASDVMGADGVEIAMAFYEIVQTSIHQSAWSNLRREAWHDVAQLEDL